MRTADGDFAMDGMMTHMVLCWALGVIVLVIAAVALVKYLKSGK